MRGPPETRNPTTGRMVGRIAILKALGRTKTNHPKTRGGADG